MQFSSSITVLKPTSSHLISGLAPEKIMAATEELRKLVIRLENVTNRFEGLDLTCLQSGNFDAVAPASAAVESAAPAQNGTAGEGEAVVAFEQILEGPLAEFMMYARRIESNILIEQCELVVKAFQLQRDFLAIATQCRSPSDRNDFVQLLTPTSEALQAAVDVRDKNRQQKEVLNHLQAIGESVGALGWVTIDQDTINKEKAQQTKQSQVQRKGDGSIAGSGNWSPAPSSFVKEMADSCTFYTNRVIREYKEQDPRHEQWCKAWVQTLKQLEEYVRRYHLTGVAWKKFGADAKTFKAGAKPKAAQAPPPPRAAAPPPPPPAGVPPPPPPPPKELLQQLDLGQSAPKARTAAGGKDALFASLNQGEAITSGLKKVDKNQMTHKNPDLRTSSVVNEDQLEKMKPGKTGPGASAKPARKKPVLECEGGKKWVVENHRNAHNVVLDQVQMKQTVYIYNCEDSLVTVEAKVNSITLDSCKKVALVFQDIVSQVDVVNCQSVRLQSQGTCPTVGIAKTDGCHVFLCEKSLNSEIITSKSSEMNISVPDDENVFVDHPVPEQFKTVWDGAAFNTEVVDIN